MEGEIYENINTGVRVIYSRLVITESEKENILPLREVELSTLVPGGKIANTFHMKENDFLRAYRLV
jgi:hypothetical protein